MLSKYIVLLALTANRYKSVLSESVQGGKSRGIGSLAAFKFSGALLFGIHSCAERGSTLS